MAKDLNPALTEVSFQVFHNRDGGADDRLVRVERRARELSALAEDILRFSPRLHADQTDEYLELAVMLRHHASGLREAAQERNVDQTVMWFWHVKNSCISCHKIYRFGEQSPLRRGLR